MTKENVFTAQCHCGNIKISATDTPTSLTSCNCSICHRIGALWAYFQASDVEIQIQNTPTSIYQWDKKEIDFHHCTQCGCTTHYQSIHREGYLQVAINARMALPDHVSNIPVRRFDGANTWKYLDD